MGTLGNAVFTNSPSSPSLTGICVHTRTLCDWSAYIGEQNVPPSPTKCILNYTCGSCSGDQVISPPRQYDPSTCTKSPAMRCGGGIGTLSG